MRFHTFGIMTTYAKGYDPFPEANFYAKMSKLADQAKLQLFVFFPESISFENRQITGYQLIRDRWMAGVFPFPDFVYDRVFYDSSYYKKNKAVVQQFKSAPGITFINRGLPSKWELYQQLYKDERIRPHLPPQQLYKDAEQLQELLRKEQSIIIKPISGGFGRKVLHLIHGNPTIVEGRNSNNQYFRKTFPTTDKAILFLAPKLSHRYLLQRYLLLNTKEGYPFDVRIFSQKNEGGIWEILGKGVRMGPKNQLTSNIHGGGRAINYERFMQQNFPNQYAEIHANIEKIGTVVPEVLERHYAPLFELGIDVGVDRFGKVWVIEANAKPGRQIFELMGDTSTSQKAIFGPIHYARYLLEREQGGSK